MLGGKPMDLKKEANEFWDGLTARARADEAPKEPTGVDLEGLRRELGEIEIHRYDQDDGSISYQLEIGTGRSLRVIGAIYDNRVIAEGVAALPALIDELERLRAAADRSEQGGCILMTKLEDLREQLNLANIDQFTTEAENHLLKAKLERVREAVKFASPIDQDVWRKLLTIIEGKEG